MLKWALIPLIHEILFYQKAVDAVWKLKVEFS